MRIQYCSDLHLEFPENRRYIQRNPLRPAGDVLLLGGDIAMLDRLDEVQDFISAVSDQYKMVYWIPGNHEYYHGDIGQRPGAFVENLRDNVLLLNNQVQELDGVKFVCTTLWSEIAIQHEFDIQRSISDFYEISDGGERLTPDRFNQLHHASMDFLSKALGISREAGLEPPPAPFPPPAPLPPSAPFPPSEPSSRPDAVSVTQPAPTPQSAAGSLIVLTHHVPTLMHYPPRYRNSPLNQAFAVELFEFIERTSAACWIYGHHHYNTPPFEIGGVRMLTNQLGYVHHHEHGSFRHDAMIEL